MVWRASGVPRRRSLLIGVAVVVAFPAIIHFAQQRKITSEVLGVWQEYLGRIDRRYDGCGIGAVFWLDADQSRRRCFDIALSLLPRDYVPHRSTVRQIGPDRRRITTIFDGGSDSLYGAAHVAVDVVRDHGVWLLTSPLDWNTRNWKRVTTGPFTYVIEPGFRFNPGRAAAAMVFVDSLARALELPTIDSLTYYLTTTVDSAYAIAGVTYDRAIGLHGGFARPTNHELFSGDSSIGEDYRHELAHLVVAPLVGRTLYLISEGVPTWLGGTTGMDFAEASRRLRSYMAQHPQLTLDSVMSMPQARESFYTAGAELIVMVNQCGGTSAVRDALEVGPALTDLRAFMARICHTTWPGVVDRWRAMFDR